MKRFLIAIPLLALVLLGAHALRQGDFGLTAAYTLIACLLFTRQEWVRWVSLGALFWGGYIWSDATVQFISFRQALGAPWERLAVIMAGVILFDALAVWTLLGESCRSFFNKGQRDGLVRASIFILTIFGLALARSKVSFPILLADRYFPGWGFLEIALLGLYAQWIGGLMLTPKGHRTVRPRIWGAFSAVFFGQLVLGLLGLDKMLMTGSLHLPVPAMIVSGPIFRGEGLFMVVLFSVTILLVGPAWCSHLCYIGAWDDAMSRLGKRPAKSAMVRRLSLWGRGGLLVLVVCAAMVLRQLGVPGAVAVMLAALFGGVGVGVMVLISRKAGLMIHCTSFCPMGLLANVFGKISPWRMKIDTDCTRCGACFTRCRYNALDEERLALGRPALSCTLCGDCVSACAHKQIGYTFPGLKGEEVRAIFIIIVVSLHAIFLGVARI